MKIQVDSDSTMQGGIRPDIRVPLNDTVIDQLYIDSIDVELKYAIGKLTSLLRINENVDGLNSNLLEPVFPNPVHSTATIQYNLEEASIVLLAVYNTYGKLVTTLVDETRQAGNYRVNWNTGDLAPGIYFYRIQTGSQSMTRKCAVL